MALAPVFRPAAQTNGNWLIASGLLGLALIVIQGFSIGLNGWTFDILRGLFGEPGPSQAGMGYGAALTATAFLIVLCHGLAAHGWCRGDAFVTSSIGVVIALIDPGSSAKACLYRSVGRRRQSLAACSRDRRRFARTGDSRRVPSARRRPQPAHGRQAVVACCQQQG